MIAFALEDTHLLAQEKQFEILLMMGHPGGSGEVKQERQHLR